MWFSYTISHLCMCDLISFTASSLNIYHPFPSIVQLTIPALATALERTYLAHLRTGLALAMSSVLISQYYTLSINSITPGTLGAQNIGVPLGCAFLIWGMVINIIGAVRFLRMQNSMLRDKAIIGGWDLLLEGLGVGVVRGHRWILYD